MDPVDDAATHLRFGVFEVDLHAGELTRRGRRVPLQAQPFQVLAMLLEQPGELVTRDALKARLWSRAVVDFDHGINKSIAKIRDALGDSADSPRFVETVARRGYRFVADVRRVDLQVTENLPQVASVEDASAPPAPARRLTVARATFALTIVVALSFAWLMVQRNGTSAIRSLVVLPLENLSGDPTQDYFADGMTDALITDLGQVGALRVISRTSAMAYRHRGKPLPEIARDLDVDAVVEGSVARTGDRVRITAQLIRVPGEHRLWTQSYEADVRDAIDLQNRIASAIVERIDVALDPREAAALGRSKAVSPVAYEAYLKGRFFWNKRTRDALQKAIEYFDRAIDADPGFAAAYSGLADSYALLADWENGVLEPQEAIPKARAAAIRALDLDDRLGEAHTSLAFIEDLYDWTWSSAENEYRRALALNPGYATAHQWYAWHLMVTGRHAEGIAEMRKAASLDPLSLIISADLADALSIARAADEAVQQSRRTIEMDPHFPVAHFLLGQAMEQKGLHAEAIVAFRRAIDLSGGNTTFEANLANAYALSGRTDEAKRLLASLEQRTRHDSPAEASIAMVHVGLGDHDRAMARLEEARRARFNPSILLRPAFDPLRGDPRFKALVQGVGLPTDALAR